MVITIIDTVYYIGIFVVCFPNQSLLLYDLWWPWLILFGGKEGGIKFCKFFYGGNGIVRGVGVLILGREGAV